MLAGVLLSFGAAIAFGVSNVLEKRSVDRMTNLSLRRPLHLARQLASSPMWVTGFLIGVASVGLVLLAYSLAPLAIVQTIQGAGLVLMVLASRFHLHEPLSSHEYAGLGLVVVGVTLVSATTTSSTAPGTGGTTTTVVATSAATVVAAVIALAGFRQSSGRDASPRFGLGAGLFYGAAALQLKSASVELSRMGVLHSIVPILESPSPYLFLFASILGLITFQNGLQRCRMGVLGPITNIVASVYLVVVGMIVFSERLPTSSLLASCRVAGFTLVLLGSWILAAAVTPGTRGTGAP